MAEAEEKQEEQQSKKKSGLMTLVKAVGVVSVLVVIQIAAASVFLPGAAETTETAELIATADAERDNEAEEVVEDEQGASISDEMVEVELGSYHVLTYDPVTGSSLNVDFDLFATVLKDEDSEFYELYTANQQRVREQVLITVRGMEVTDFTDAGLGLIKRKILEKTNRALGKPLLHEAIFSKFSFIER
ncbi:MAG: hypothetical protein AAGA92_12495 [Planctomycetota bacterium]